MSEFTIGVLFLSADEPLVKAEALKTGVGHVIRPLNSKWSTLFLEDERLEKTKTREALAAISGLVPLLRFFNDEDRGWGYDMWDKGSKVATFYFDYEVLYKAAESVAEARHPGVNIWDEEGRPHWDGVIREAKQAPAFQQQFADINVGWLRLFELNSIELARAGEALSPQFPDVFESPWARVETFKKALGMEEMSWMSYQYLEREGAPTA